MITKKVNAKVNSLHGQGINKIGKNIIVEAKASDTTIEAISLKNSKAWSLGVQWHPELSIDMDSFSKKLFIDFGLACKKRNDERKN